MGVSNALFPPGLVVRGAIAISRRREVAAASSAVIAPRVNFERHWSAAANDILPAASSYSFAAAAVARNSSKRHSDGGIVVRSFSSSSYGSDDGCDDEEAAGVGGEAGGGGSSSSSDAAAAADADDAASAAYPRPKSFFDPESPPPVTFADISRASVAIRSGIVRTPCERSHFLSEVVGANVYLKPEIRQFTGSFKERGARNAVLTLLLEDTWKGKDGAGGVIAASAGNHALALAYHGKELGVPVTVVMPTLAPLAKVDKCRVSILLPLFLRGMNPFHGIASHHHHETLS